MSVLPGNLTTKFGRMGRGVKQLVTSRRFWILTGITLGAIIVIQLVYPHNRALPFARLDSQTVGMHTIDEMTQMLTSRYHNATIATQTPATKLSFKDVGVKLAVLDSVDSVVQYPWWQRLIPFSSVVRMVNGHHPARLEYQSLPISQWAATIVQKCEQKSVDASIAVAGEGELKLVPGTAGRQCNDQRVIDSLKSAQVGPSMRVDTRYSVLQPKRTDAQVSQQLNMLRKVLTSGITFDVSGTKTTADAKTITGWLTFSDGPNNTVLADVDPAKVQPFISHIQKPIYISPGVTTISMRDGVEIARQNGTPGQGIDAAKLLDAVRVQLRQQKTGAIVASLAPIAPRQDVQRSYTNSPAGLQALLNDLVVGKDMAISVREISGQGRVLSANGDKTYHPASTYKLFIAYSVIRRVEVSQLAWGDQINGTTVDECLTRMIVDSDNACAEAFADKFTWGTVQNELKALGMTKTNLNSPQPVSTVSDQTLFLQKLDANQLMKPENKDKLLELMKRQRFRSGIPAGVGVPAADKVGFLSGVLHDSAIVYAPKGTYMLSIYSSGGSWGAIADAAKQINQLLAS